MPQTECQNLLFVLFQSKLMVVTLICFDRIFPGFIMVAGARMMHLISNFVSW